MTEAKAQPAPATTAKAAGRGGLAVAAAKLYFIIVGLVQQIALKAVLGLDGYGALSSALSAASITYNPVVQTSIQSVSRVVASADAEQQPFALRRALKLNSVVAFVVGGGFLLLAQPVANWMGAPHITLTLQLLSAVMVLYGLYAPLVGALNGYRRFVAQAGLDALAATLRTIGLIGCAYWFSHRAASVTESAIGGVEGAVLGFVGGASIVFLVSVVLVGWGKAGGTEPTYRRQLGYLVPLFLGQILLNLLFQADALLLRRFASDAAAANGLDGTAADSLVGAYRAAQLFCFLPYQMLMSVTFVLFPMLAHAQASSDKDAVRRYVENGVRLAAVVAGLLVSVTAGLPRELIGLVFGHDTAVLGAPAMQVLAIGLGFLALFGILTAVLNSLGQERASLIVTGLAFALVVVLCVVFVRGGEFGEGLLERTAWATSAGLVLATIAAGAFVARAAGGVVSALSLLRVALGVAAATSVGHLLPESSKVMTLLYAPVVASIYVAVLALTRELNSNDLANLKAVVRR